MKRTNIILITCAFILTGINTETAYALSFSSIMKKWVGASKEELLSKWSIPDSQQKVEGGTLYIYGSPKSSCTVKIYVVDDKVHSSKWYGRSCRRIRRESSPDP